MTDQTPSNAPTDRQRRDTEQWVIDCGLFCADCDAQADDEQTDAWLKHLWDDPEPLPYSCPDGCPVVVLDVSETQIDRVA